MAEKNVKKKTQDTKKLWLRIVMLLLALLMIFSAIIFPLL